MKFKSKKTEVEFEYNPLKTNFIIGDNGTGKTHFLNYLQSWLDARGPIRSEYRPDVNDFELLADIDASVQYIKLAYTGEDLFFNEEFVADEQIQTLLKEHYNVMLDNDSDLDPWSFGHRNIISLFNDVFIIKNSALFDHSLPIVIQIDMPEIGLSLNAQQHLMDDLIAVAGGDIYFTVVTHAPEIIYDFEARNKGKLINFNS